jgi:hypothetical protein
LACLIFMWQPISSGEYFGAGDVSGLASVVRPDGADPGPLPQIDVTIQMLPWTDFTVDQVRSGKLPTWNPYNNSGVPHLANIQTAAFSPFHVPFYVLPMRLALLVSSYLMSMTAGMLTYGLLRHLRASHLAGVISALAYMFCGYMVFWHGWPLAAVAAFVPGLVWASSALVRAADWRRSVTSACAVMVTVAGMVVTGHPETMFFGVFPAVAWSAAWLVDRRVGVRTFGVKMAHLAGAGLAGAALSAVQLLPFLEYLSQSPTAQSRTIQGFHSPRWLSVQAFPLAHGSPAMDYVGPYNFAVGFHETMILYVGFVALSLAAFALVSPLWTRKRTPLLFGLVLAVTFAYVFDVAGFGRLVSSLPIFDLAIPSRSGSVWALCVSVLAGLGVDALRSAPAPGAERRRRRLVTAVAVASSGALAFLGYRAWHIYEYMDYGTAALRSLASRTLVHHLVFVGVVGTIGIGCAVTVASSRLEPVRRAAAVGLVLMVFLEGGFLLRGQNASVPAEKFRNFAPRVHQIAEEIGDNQALWIDRAHLLPDVNLWVPTSTPDNYDVIGIATYDRLYRELLRPPEAITIGGAHLGMLSGPYDPVDTHALQVLGVRRIVTARGYPFADGVHLAARADKTRVDGGGTYSFRWRSVAPRELVVYVEGAPPGTTLEATVTVEGSEETIERELEIHGTLAVAELPDGIPDTGKMFVNLRWPGGVEGGAAPATITGTTLVNTATPGLELVDSNDGYQIFSVPGPSGFFTSPAATEHVVSNQAAFDRVTDPSFDPSTTVVVEGDGEGSSGRSHRVAGRVEVGHFEPRDASVVVHRTSPGYVVFHQNDYPGWRATVDGERVPIERADSTYMAVKVPSGTSTVRFRFESSSVVIGACVSIAAMLCGLGAFVATRIRGRRCP